ncbi:hypothetical protein ACFPOE_01365 [Caenimonas terrae]|uniref:DUF4402 domain-containing protein n=1 Tax=Caenimonas terrae TaxID=696074 RepID=A0ABW0N693_9BURK
MIQRIACLAAPLLLLVPVSSHAYLVSITSGTKSIFLQVGTGTMTGGTFQSGGTPGNNATVNTVSVNVPAASVGTGPRGMTPDVIVVNSPWDNYAFCPYPAPVYVGGFYRASSGTGSATLAVTSPANLVSGANTLSFNTISWVSAGASDATPTIPSGTFAAGTTQTLLTIARNYWFESCLTFTYANAAVLPAGTYTQQVVYSLTAP